MNDLQIEYFLAAARNMSFSKAAQELFVSQPAISRQILALEQELGCPLFERLNRGIVLTTNGEMFYDFFERYRGELFDLKLRAKLSLENKKQVLHFGVLNNWDISEILLPVLQDFSKEYPNVKVEVNSYEPRSSQEALQSGKEDVIITIEPKILNIQGIMHAKVADLPRVLIYSTANTPKYDRVLTPYDFREEEFLAVAGEDNDYVTDLIRSVCKPYGFTPKIQPVHSTDAMIMGVQCGLGVAVTDSWSRALDNPGFAYLNLESTHPLSVVWINENQDPAINRFVSLLKKVIRMYKWS